jgi:hypothetical protein
MLNNSTQWRHCGRMTCSLGANPVAFEAPRTSQRETTRARIITSKVIIDKEKELCEH